MLGVEEETPSEDSRNILTDTGITCRNAVEIMDNSLIYEKLGSDSLYLEYSHFDMIDLVNELIESLQASASSSPFRYRPHAQDSFDI